MSLEVTGTEAVTRVISKLHRIRWTIENVSELLEETEIKGPELYYQKTYMCQISFKKEYNRVYIKLYNKSSKAIKMMKSKIVLMDCDGKKLRETKDEIETLPRTENVSLMIGKNMIGVLDSLKNDKLIVYCCLKFLGEAKLKSFTLQSETEYQKESRTKLLMDLKKMYNNPDCSDFTFQVEDGFIYAHKAVLSFRSAYFKGMFETQMKENVQNSVLITDASYSTMKNLVEFLYTGNFNKTVDEDIQDVWSLYIAADKYQVLDLRSLCGMKLISTATVDNIIEILQLAALHNDEDLKTKAMEFISLDFAAIVNSNSWQTLQMSEVCLASEVLNFYFKRVD